MPPMANALDRRICPFCGQEIVLGECPIVATNVPDVQATFSPDGARPAKGNDERRLPPSKTPVIEWINGWPVVAHGQLQKLQQKGLPRFVAGVLTPALLPVTELAAAEDLPARACTKCGWPLPVEFDERPLFTIAVVGTRGAGKTHYLASVLRDAARLQGLARLGCEEFAPDEQTARRYHTDYFEKLFQDQAVLKGTPQEEDALHKPLVFRVSFRDCTPSVVMMHDVAGEVLQDRGKRAQAASFVRRADGVIFLVDSVQLKPIRDLLAGAGPERPANQADLLVACINDMGPRARRRVPYAITLSKSDLIASALADRSFRFCSDPPAHIGEWGKDLKIVEGEVHRLLSDRGAHDLLAAASQLELLSYHAVAPIGADPRNGRVEDLHPLRCLDPLATVLTRIPGITDPAGR